MSIGRQVFLLINESTNLVTSVEKLIKKCTDDQFDDYTLLLLNVR